MPVSIPAIDIPESVRSKKGRYAEPWQEPRRVGETMRRRGLTGLLAQNRRLRIEVSIVILAACSDLLTKH